MPQTAPIYLDNAATTRVAAEVADVVAACLRDDFGNPSSAHAAGIAAEKRVKTATETLRAVIGDAEGAGKLYWTSGGTESDAMGVLGAGRARVRRGKRVVYAVTEHPAVRESAKQLGKEGWTVQALPVTKAGVVDVDQFVDGIDEHTSVAALMLVNNEIGTINPVAEVAAALADKRPDVHLHCDAVQALGKIAVDVRALGAHSVAFAGHKLHAPKGIGAIWLRDGARLEPLWSGGGQQEGVRSGTHNVPGIAAMGAAAALANQGMSERQDRWASFAAILRAAAERSGVQTRINGADAPRAPHVLSIAFKGLPAEPLLHVLESRGVLVSAGSACAERSRKPSPVLTAIGVGPDWGTLRFSFGRETTVDEVERAAEILVAAVESF